MYKKDPFLSKDIARLLFLLSAVVSCTLGSFLALTPAMEYLLSRGTRNKTSPTENWTHERIVELLPVVVNPMSWFHEEQSKTGWLSCKFP